MTPASTNIHSSDDVPSHSHNLTFPTTKLPVTLAGSLAVEHLVPLPTVEDLASALPLSAELREKIQLVRSAIASVLAAQDPRLLIIAGPCSLHDLDEATEFAEKFRILQEEVKDSFLLVMRAMFEKPRSSIGWKGIVHQEAGLDGLNMPKALPALRKFFLKCASDGVPLAAEALDPSVTMYLIDLLSYVTIGARTSESQVHRQFASMLSVPVGVKNPTSGDLKTAIDSVQAVATPQSVLLTTSSGEPAQAMSNGNCLSHLVLRGGLTPNYYPADVLEAVQLLEERSRATGRELLATMVVDCSHGNSRGDYLRQLLVFQECIATFSENKFLQPYGVKGFMLEVNLQPGKQLLQAPSRERGVSLTDACIGFESFASAIRGAHAEISAKRQIH